MSIKKYEAFVKTVQLGSLTKAAEVLGTTQSRISHILSDLEEEYGFSLMRRGRGGVQLTEAGTMVYPHMEEIIQKNMITRETPKILTGKCNCRKIIFFIHPLLYRS